MHDSTITMPAEFMPAKAGEVLIVERQIWAEKDGSITAAAWSRRFSLKLPNGRGFPERQLGRHRGEDGRCRRVIAGFCGGIGAVTVTGGISAGGVVTTGGVCSGGMTAAGGATSVGGAICAGGGAG